jgi:phosphatidylserine/phosphatidylglycerophosphate/cardiolipin synthase-like enzyme
MKKILTALFVVSMGANAQSIFIPENGKYDYHLDGIAAQMSNFHYVLQRTGSNEAYKLDKKRNEYIVKNWFQHDWYVMQNMFSLNMDSFISSQKASTFNEAKRKQYARFAFDKKGFFHYKTVPTMKEWGGLTHPPIKKIDVPLEKIDKNFAPIDYSTIKSPYFSPILQLELDRLTKSELTFGNKVIPLADRAVFEKKKEMIRNARESILMSSLVYVCDAGTKQIVNLLIKKHREGVDVKVLTDGFIGKLLGHTECLKTMRDAGILVIETKDFLKHKLKAIYHTKTLVTDFSEAVAGGHNMIDADNLSRGTDFMNRDVDLYIKGPMVTDIAKQFVENWAYQTIYIKGLKRLTRYENEVVAKLKEERKAGVRGDEFYNRILSNPVTRMAGVCRFIKQAPYQDGHSIGKAYLKLLDRVQKHLVITDPVKSDTYVGKPSDAPISEMMDPFDMFNKLHNKVQSLAKNGLPIDYITTNINMAGNENVAIMNERIKDQLNVGKKLVANWSLVKLIASNSYYGKPHYKNLMTDWLPIKNVHIWTHMSFMHSKIFYFDRVAASVGSYNFQHNATDQAYESTSICMDEGLNRELDKILVQDMANSIPLIFSGVR